MPGLPFEQLPAQDDPLTMLGEMTKRQLADLEQQASQAEQQATAESQNRLQTLRQEWQIEKQGLEQEWNQLLDMNLDQETLSKHWNRLKLGVAALQQKYALADTRIRGKNRPDLLAIQQAKQNAIMKINQEARDKQIRIDQIRRMVVGGALDPYEGKSEELGLVGHTISASQLRPATPAQQIQEIDRDVKLLDAGTLNIGGGKTSNDLTMQEKAKYKADMYTRRNKLSRQMGGQYAGPMQTATRLQRVAAEQMADSFTQGIAEQKPKRKPLTREVVEQYKKAGLTKEQARQMAVQEGYTID
jgi:hypothetical protein